MARARSKPARERQKNCSEYAQEQKGDGKAAQARQSKTGIQRTRIPGSKPSAPPKIARTPKHSCSLREIVSRMLYALSGWMFRARKIFVNFAYVDPTVPRHRTGIRFGRRILRRRYGQQRAGANHARRVVARGYPTRPGERTFVGHWLRHGH